MRDQVPDDRIVASALELGRENLVGRIAMTANDRNVHNIARLAGLAIIAPDGL